MAASATESAAMKLEAKDLDTAEKRGKYTVCVIGCGRIGLPTACVFAETGFQVIGVDADPSVIGALRKGKASFIETGLATLVKKCVKAGRIKATGDAIKAVSQSDIVLIVVATMVDEKRKPDYSHIERACKDVGMGLRRGTLIILSSTVGPGVTENLVRDALENASGLKAGKDFGLANSPTRAAPGRVLQDLVTYARIVGAINEESFRVADLILGTICKGKIIKVRDMRTAETVKLFENVYRDVCLALSNDFGLLCEKTKVDYLEAQAAANTQPYCHLLRPGIVGGHIPKDPYLLLEEAENAGANLSLVALARKINDAMPQHAVQLARDALGRYQKPFRRAKIALLGVSYSPNTKEHRGSAIGRMVKAFTDKGALVRVFDPLYSYKELKDLGYPAERTLSKAVEGTDCIVIVVGHNRFKRLNLKKLKMLMTKSASIVDMGHVIEPERAEKAGFIYRGVGRGVWTK
jgi:UDP-N-acetyl-D-mannosaminuronic acid dehydrogenase